MILGKTAFVDLSAGAVSIEETPEDLVRSFLGGRGANMAYLHRLLAAGADPLGPENVLIFGCGLLTGYPVPSSGRMNISAKSPESGILGDANMGGFFPAELRKAGFDRLVITGRSAEPVYLYASGGRLELRPALAYWGLDAWDTQVALERDSGPGVRSAAIGYAGENLVRFACIMNGRKNAAGRGGMGAVMGSKLLKAVVARGDAPPPVYDRDALLERRRELNAYLHDSKVIQIMGRLGTPLLYANHVRVGALRTKNSQLNQWTSDLDAQHVEEHVERMVACAGCSVHCRHINRQGGEGPEFVTLGLMGANCGVEDVVDLIEINNLCNALGLDTSSAGTIIPWAMELYQRGIIDDELTGGPLEWGDVPAIKRLLLDIAGRRGFGDVLAESTQALTQGKLPPRARDYLIAIKNLPQSDPHDVRFIKSFALAEAVSSRGADHLRNRPTLDIMGLADEIREAVYGEPTDGAPTSYATKEIVVEWSENIFAAIDCLGMCRFVCRGWNSPKLLSYLEFSELAWKAVGLEISPAELVEVARRVVDLERIINMREGITRADDTLPRRYFDDPLPLGPSKGHHIDRAEFAALLTRYYRRRGWDDEGVPSPERVAELATRTRAAAPGDSDPA